MVSSCDTSETRGPRRRNVLHQQLSVVQCKRRLCIFRKSLESHPPKIVTDEGQDHYVMVEPSSVTKIMEIHLIETVPRDTGVDGFEPVIEGGELLAPSMVVVNARSEGHRIAHADNSELVRWNFRIKRARRPKSLRVDPHVDAGVEIVLFVIIWDIGPA